MRNNIHDLMLSFMRLEGARVGSGPLDPTCEEPHLVSTVRRLLDDNPILASDSGYVTFLKYYAGAAIERPAGHIVHIWGPAQAVSHYVWDRLALNPEDGFAPICCAQLPDQERVEFYLSAGPLRPDGVYWAMRNGDRVDVEWHCHTFAELLNQVVRTNGTFVPPA